jgi:acetolactate synthase small subunit
MMMTHYYKVTLKVKNEVGVLARITILLRKFRVNIRSLDVAPIENEELFSEIHMVLETEKDEREIDVVMKKTQRLIPVVSAECTLIKSEK